MMKHRLNRARYRYIKEALYSEDIYMGGEQFTKIYNWGGDEDLTFFILYKYIANKGKNIDDSEYSLVFNMKDLYILKVNQYLFYTDDQFKYMVERTNEIARKGKFKEVWIEFSNANYEVIDQTTNSKLSIQETFAKLNGYNLLNLHVTGNTIKWSVL